MKTNKQIHNKANTENHCKEKYQELINYLYVVSSKGLFPFPKNVNLLAKTKSTSCYGIQIAK